MKVNGFVVKEEEYQGHSFYALYVVIDNKEYLIGTLKGKDFKYIKTIRKEK